MQHAASLSPAPAPAASPRAPYTIQLSPARRQLRLTIAGFWRAGTMTGFIDALTAAVDQLGCARDEFTICCDISHVAIQPQDVVHSFGAIIVQGEPRPRKVALWTSAMLPRMQARRLSGLGDFLAMFDSEAEAQRWLAVR